MLSPSLLERRFLADLPAKPATNPNVRSLKRTPPLTHFQLAVAIMVAVGVLAVLTASLRLTERAINDAVKSREAPARYLADEMLALRLMAMSARSPVPGRLYLGIEECFKARAAVPFNAEDHRAAQQLLATCADMEIGRLYAGGGTPMAEEGQRVLQQAGLARH